MTDLGLIAPTSECLRRPSTGLIGFVVSTWMKPSFERYEDAYAEKIKAQAEDPVKTFRILKVLADAESCDVRYVVTSYLFKQSAMWAHAQLRRSHMISRRSRHSESKKLRVYPVINTSGPVLSPMAKTAGAMALERGTPETFRAVF